MHSFSEIERFNMDEGRLGITRRQENFRRKAVYVQNDLAKTKWKRINAHIAKEKHDSTNRFDKSKMIIRREIVRQKVLQKCLKMRRNDIQGTRDSILGCYGGKPLHAFARDIDQTIAFMHPRLRRLRKVEEQIRESVECGKIVCEDELRHKIKGYFDEVFKEKEAVSTRKKKSKEKKEDKNDIFSHHRNYIPPIRGIVNPFYKFVNEEGNNTLINEQQSIEQIRHSDDGDEKAVVFGSEIDEIENKTNQMKLEGGNSTPPLKNKILHQGKTKTELEKKASLILPPISLTRNLVGKNY